MAGSLMGVWADLPWRRSGVVASRLTAALALARSSCATATTPAGDEVPGAEPAEPAGVTGPAADALDRRIHLPALCWWFMGLAVYRAWIEVAFVGSFVPYPRPYPMRTAYDVTCVVTLLLCALCASRLSPLHASRLVRVACPTTMALASAAGFVCLWRPELAGVVAPPAAVMGGVGVALMILLWSELYGCLNPVRIALYYALSQLVGAAIIWTLRGFLTPWLAVYTCLLPVVSLVMLRHAFLCVPAEHLPRATRARFSFPWKPVALVSVYAFAFGMQEANLYAYAGPHSNPGMALAALIVVIGILLLGRWVEFGTIYSVWLPGLMMVSLVVSIVAPLGSFATSQLAGLSYGAAEIFIMTMIGSICYRYGVNAVWIFGIERGVRLTAMILGRTLGAVAFTWEVSAVVIVAAAVGTWLIFSERGLSADWGIVLYEEGDDLYRTALMNARARACGALARAHGLTEREGEVLLLLANRKGAAEIGNELCIANGTAKAHIRHVYHKLGIHSRDELHALVDEAIEKERG